MKTISAAHIFLNEVADFAGILKSHTLITVFFKKKSPKKLQYQCHCNFANSSTQLLTKTLAALVGVLEKEVFMEKNTVKYSGEIKPLRLNIFSFRKDVSVLGESRV